VVGVRKSDKELAARIQQALDSKNEEIEKVLREYGLTLAAAAPPVSPAQNRGATIGMAPPGVRTASAGDAAEQVDKLLATEDEYQGWKWFHVYCFRCHGIDALGSDLAPNLRKSISSEGLVTHEGFLKTVRDGRQEKAMQSWKALLEDPQIEQLYQYVRARSAGRLAAGRPHRANTK
jgi:mono/diheme cytochrome c family protein